MVVVMRGEKTSYRTNVIFEVGFTTETGSTIETRKFRFDSYALIFDVP